MIMDKVFIAPRRYVQGPGVLGRSGDLISKIGKRVMILWDAPVRGIVGAPLLADLKKSDFRLKMSCLPATRQRLRRSAWRNS
jgi:glycerol dehydrogenase-like iron-containing ADH family enzyme